MNLLTKLLRVKWITNTDFVVVHRVAIATNHLGQGYAKMIMKHREFCDKQYHL
jgi:hypothetical protein